MPNLLIKLKIKKPFNTSKTNIKKSFNIRYYLTVIFFVLVLNLSYSTTLHAENKKTYFGYGGSYTLGNFDFDSGKVEVDFDDALGVNLKAGYYLENFFSLEVDFDYLHKFPWKRSTGAHDKNINITSYTLLAKFLPDFESKSVKPFLVFGTGLMHGDVTGGISNTNVCVKAGWGIDFFVNDKVSVGLEGVYLFGFGSVNEFVYPVYTLGISYHI